MDELEYAEINSARVMDELIKEKLDGREFPLDEMNWDRAERMIIRSQNISRTIRIGSLFTGGVIVGILIMLPFTQTGNRLISSLSPAAKKANGPAITTGLMANSSSKPSTPVNSTPTTNIPATSVNSEPVSVAVSQPKTSSVLTRAVPESSSQQSPQQSIATVQIASASIGSKESEPTSPNSHSDSYRYPILNTTPFLNSLAEIEPKLNAENTSPINNSEIKPTGGTETKQYVKLTYPRPSNTLSLTLGADYSFGWNNNSGTEARGFNYPILGFNYTCYLNRKWAISGGAEYYTLSHIASYYSSTNTHYEFGLTDTTTAVHPQTLMYASVPLQVLFCINTKNMIGAGASFLYLINTSSQVTEYTQSSLSPQTTISSTTKYDYYDGFNAWDFEPMLTYTRKFSPSISVSLQAYYGLVNVKQSGFFEDEDNKNDRNSGLKLTFNYAIIK
jgi:hypothetical protein